MWTGIEFLVLLQDWRESLPQFFTDFFTFVSSPVFYMFIPVLLGIIFYMVVDKKKGEFICLNTIFAYNIANLIKFIVKQPRPWELDPEIHVPPESTHSGGYSLPSAHSAISVAGYGSLAAVVAKKWLKAVFVVIAVLIVFSRLFLCVHTPLDVIVGVVMALAIVSANWYLLKLSYRSEKNYDIIAAGYIIASFVISAVVLALMDSDVSNAYMGAGFLMGFAIGRFCEHKYVKYEIPDVSIGKKALICVLGAVVTFIFILGFSAIGDVWGMVGTFLSMIWLSAAYPYIVMKKFS